MSQHLWYALWGLILSTTIHAQIIIKGLVTDTMGRPLPQANVLLMEQSGIVAFGTTNAQGRFELVLQHAQNPLVLQVSYLGYALYADSLFAATNQTIYRHVQLHPLPLLLQEARIEYEVPLTVKEDTVIYTVDSFITGNERNLKDILKRLPGLEVTPRGEVYFLGQLVSKVLVEGEEFFGGDVRTATENIPADVVERIEVLSNYTDVGLMKSIVQQGEIAINVQLKQDQQSFWFGDLRGGGGIPRKYVAAGTLYRYHPMWNFNILGNVNNLSPSHSYGSVAFDAR